MNDIELYFGGQKPPSRSEQAVLAQVLRWLIERQRPAVVICDLLLKDGQIDILVGTDDTTIQLEIKNFHHPVDGKSNGDWMLRREASPTPIKNGYRQAMDNNLALRDAMSRHFNDGREISYPSGAVIFEPSRHRDSRLEITYDPRVLIHGADELDRALSKRGRQPWPRSWLSHFAQAQNLTRAPISAALRIETAQGKDTIVQQAEPGRDAADRVPVVPTVVPAMPAAVPAASTVVPPVPTALAKRAAYPIAAGSPAERSPATIDASWREAQAVAIPHRHAPIGSGLALGESRPRRRRGLLRYWPILLAAALGAYAIGQHQRKTVKAEAPLANEAPDSLKRHASSIRKPHDAPPVPLARTQRAAHRATADKPQVVAAAPSAEGPVDPALPIASRPTPPIAPITCPVGVDRLGCNGRTGVLATPECPPAFHISGNTCIRDAGD
ncbi:NERD domain-containing protein [Burkholderia sp. Cy-637]|uniref:NERD domain-containing protein n=1 Tax=Burkholderia sp. Cy-637 TaxID=2608327 RepID=UPI0014210C6B|nr:NERD domain-containing protein [Burkholderia sp. Cy-637]